MNDSDDLMDLLPIPGLEPPPDPPEVVAGKIAGEIFRPWYKEYYEGRYTQSIPHIMKVLKKVVLDLMLNGTTSKEDIAQALAHVGKSQQVVTPLTLQYSLSRLAKIQQTRDEAGMNGDMVPQEDFHKFLMHGISDDLDYGETGQEF